MSKLQVNNNPVFSNQAMEGKIVRVLPGGYGYVKQDSNGRTYIFSFDAIQGYRGQSAKRLGLRRGTKVSFLPQGDRITSLEVNNR